ncbi:hypothetical protein [Sinanaerobacter sp. ZZT-01]|uniref:lysine 5,6-aminomutase reactivase subunit KamB n=1 Tax=Sinanaerobacter sp. ZZT-01 TaxID=3111540 RepID=UPI002D77975E|nr:hypothetical protein [Sinanaerobacter sp. ZZT-01]WRR94539.1 hypothetical protein U5921_05325 [Sinanaerobacter sp. ZZT-01]
MSLLYQLQQKYKTLSIVGMAKNAGKTTALNYLIEEAMDEGMILGVTSTGRDGESSDLVTGTEKPKVYLDAGTIVSVPVQLYDLAETGLEIIRKTKYSTSLGELLLCRVAESGYVQIAGPVNTVEHKKLCKEMEELGAELILIDGAIDRKSIASPETSDAIILSTGAVLSRSMKKVVEETVHVVSLYTMPELPQGIVRDILCKQLNENEKERITLISDKNEMQFLDLKTGLGASRFLDEAIDDNTQYVYIPGALTTSVFEDIHPAKRKKIQFILKDPTKIFIGSLAWQQLKKRGFHVCVLENIEVAAVTVNPYAPSGYSFDHDELKKAMEDALEGIPVIDVKLGGCV